VRNYFIQCTTPPQCDKIGKDVAFYIFTDMFEGLERERMRERERERERDVTDGVVRFCPLKARKK